MPFLREAFSEDGQASSSRLLMAFHAVAAASWITYHLATNAGHPLPDAGTMVGLTTFVTAPYALNVARVFAPQAKA